MTEHALEPPAQLDPPPDAVTPEAATRSGGAQNGSAPAGLQTTLGGIGSTGDRDATPDSLGSCTQAQLRRFIKSRPYVPLHELRRRFGLNGSDDDVSPVDVDGHRIFVGLPARESGLLGELLRQGDVGYELLLDPTSPMIIGVFPMRPVQRP
jgi:hypothetical protein